MQAAKIDQEKGLSELQDRIVQVYGLTAKTPTWNKKRKQFEAELPSLLDNLAEGTRIPAAELKAAKKQCASHKTKAQAFSCTGSCSSLLSATVRAGLAFGA